MTNYCPILAILVRNDKHVLLKDFRFSPAFPVELQYKNRSYLKLLLTKQMLICFIPVIDKSLFLRSFDFFFARIRSREMRKRSRVSKCSE